MPGTAPRTIHRVLVVDDERAQADLLAEMLGADGFETVAVCSPDAALAELARGHFDVVISDYRMPGMTGLDLYREVQRTRRDIVFIIVTAYGRLETAVEAMKAGVFDFVTKPVDMDELTLKLKKALRVRHLEDENTRLKAAVDHLRDRVQIIGASARMKAVMADVEQVAPSQATVLIKGESGTGKELIARALHLASPRHGGPYVKVNCAAIPDQLLEDELFGHAKGAFTGAIAGRTGKFEAAHGGTIFLDEIGDLPLHLQPKILRVIQEREVEPLGSNEVRPVDVRLVTATNRDLAAMVTQGTFRQDLFYRLNVIPIVLPPLRDRLEDVPALAAHFLQRFCERDGRRFRGFTKGALDRLMEQSWPGNVRELENCVERAVVLGAGEAIDAPDILVGAGRAAGTVPSILDALFTTDMTLDGLESELIVQALKRNGGNISRTARTLGITRRALQYRIEKIRAGRDDVDGADDSDAGEPRA